MTTLLNRRELFALSAAAVGQSALIRAAGVRQPARRALGVQLYTVRDQLARDPAAVLARLAAIGYTEIEVIQPTLSTVAPIARKAGLSIVSVHLDWPTVSGDGFAAFIAEAKGLGIRYLVVPFVPPGERPADRAGFERFADRLSAMTAQASSAGLQVAYHNHAFEFAKDRDGTRWLDVLMEGTSASGMRLELDVFWAAITGADPIEVIQRYGKRIALMHLKDKEPKAPATLVEKEVARGSFVEVGAGALDFRAILAAAGRAGVSHYFVEQDYTPGDPVESLKKSYGYLSRIAN